jgi:hypothetical protein
VVFSSCLIGTTNWKYGYIKDPLHRLIFAIIMGSASLLWYFRNKLDATKVNYGFACLGLFLWLLAGDALTKPFGQGRRQLC